MIKVESESEQYQAAKLNCPEPKYITVTGNYSRIIRPITKTLV